MFFFLIFLLALSLNIVFIVRQLVFTAFRLLSALFLGKAKICYIYAFLINSFYSVALAGILCEIERNFISLGKWKPMQLSFKNSKNFYSNSTDLVSTQTV